MIKGVVYLDRDEDGKRGPDEPGISGVAVSNGYDVSITDAEGRYELGDPPEGLIWVTVPAGYRSPGPFYLRVDGPNADFALMEELQLGAFSFVYYTDLHLNEGARGPERFAETLREIAALRPSPEFCIDGGDITLQGGCGERYKALIDGFPLRVYHSMGNHEHFVERPDPKGAYRDLFGPTYYSFNYGGAHFVILDAMKVDLSLQGWQSVVGMMSGRELNWLKADLAYVGRETPVVIASHIPLWTTFDERRGVGRTNEPAWLIMNYEAVLEALSPYNVKLILQGHLHENEHHREGGIHFLTTGAVCGSWWDQSGEMLCPDGSPKGYRIVHVAGSKVSSIYKSTGRPLNNQLQIDKPVEGESVKGRFAVEVNVFDGSNRTEVAFSLDGVRWRPIRLEPSYLTDTGRACAHRWVGEADVTDRPAGTHYLQVKASDPAWGTVTEMVGIIGH